MYRIEYAKGSSTYKVYTPFDDTYSILSGIYHRETNTVGQLTFSILYNHPCYNLFEEYSGIISLYWKDTLLYKFRIIKIRRDLYNKRYIECAGLLCFLTDSVVAPYTFNETNYIYPVTPSTSHTCTVPQFMRELIALHNVQMPSAQQFEFVDETNGYFDSTTFTTSSTSYTSTWQEIESKVLKNVGGYLQIRFGATVNQVVLKAALTENNAQTIQFAVNLKSLELETSSQKFATAIYPVSTYTDASGHRQTVDIYNVNSGVPYVEDASAVSDYGRIVAYVPYEGIVSAERLKWFANHDLTAYINKKRSISISAVDMAAVDGSAPLEVDKRTHLVSVVNSVDTTAVLNAFDVDILNPINSHFTFNGEVPAFTKRVHLFKN